MLVGMRGFDPRFPGSKPSVLATHTTSQLLVEGTGIEPEALRSLRLATAP